MPKPEYPVTTGVRALQTKKIPFVPHLYPYVEHGGTRHAAECLGVAEHTVVKTLVMEPDGGRAFLVLMHGDREVSTKNLARALKVKTVTPCDTEKAERVTGYQVGGISPFGTRQALPVYVQSSIMALPRIYINGGKRGFLVEISTEYLRQALMITEVDVAISE